MKTGTTMAIAILLACMACTKSAKETGETPPNTLTEQQKAEGWQLLFDGQTMSGWRIFKGYPNDSWEVADGALHCKPPKTGEGAVNERSDIITENQYGNFELMLEWKISEAGNSGIMYRVTEEFDQPYYSGPEYQVLDDEAYPGHTQPAQFTGANYDMHVAEPKVTKPAGEWNQTKIVVNGNQVEHWLNGTKVVEYELGSEDWLNRKNNSKWKDASGYGMAAQGHIALQDHGNEVWYRSILIRPL
jgi:hypothetical protein